MRYDVLLALLRTLKLLQQLRSRVKHEPPVTSVTLVNDSYQSCCNNVQQIHLNIECCILSPCSIVYMYVQGTRVMEQLCLTATEIRCTSSEATLYHNGKVHMHANTLIELLCAMACSLQLPVCEILRGYIPNR